MIGLYVFLTLLLLMMNVISVMFIAWMLRGILTMVWRRITKPTTPPWRRNGLEKNHEHTAKNPRNCLHPRLLVTP